MSAWGYKKDNGPSLWSKWYPVADLGERQSPIDIKTSAAVPADDMSELKYQYDPANIRIVNTGATWRMDFSAEGSNLSGGPLQGDYKILQMHAHWGSAAGKGSEHTMDGVEYDAELHIVHYNDKYGDPSVAVDKPDGLAVLGMFIKTGASNPEIEKICKHLSSISIKDMSVTMEHSSIDPTKLLPANKTFFTYPGSLTTPPLFESVTWLVFKEPVEMSAEQLETMRKLKISQEEECQDCMVDNYRPPCPLSGRTVRVKNC